MTIDQYFDRIESELLDAVAPTRYATRFFMRGSMV